MSCLFSQGTRLLAPYPPPPRGLSASITHETTIAAPRRVNLPPGPTHHATPSVLQHKMSRFWEKLRQQTAPSMKGQGVPRSRYRGAPVTPESSPAPPIDRHSLGTDPSAHPPGIYPLCLPTQDTSPSAHPPGTHPPVLTHQVLALSIQCTGGFIQDEDRRVPYQSPRHGHTLLLPARQLCPLLTRLCG